MEQTIFIFSGYVGIVSFFTLTYLRQPFDLGFAISSCVMLAILGIMHLAGRRQSIRHVNY